MRIEWEILNSEFWFHSTRCQVALTRDCVGFNLRNTKFANTEYQILDAKFTQQRVRAL